VPEVAGCPVLRRAQRGVGRGHAKKRIEKLKYIHRNPVKRGLVERPEDWACSRFRHYLTGEPGVVEPTD